MERNSEVHCLADHLSLRRQFCKELQHTLQGLIERCPLGSTEGLQLIEDYVMKVKHKRQHICFESDVHFKAFAFVGGQHRLSSGCPSSDAFVIAAVSKRFQLQMQAHFPKLRAQRTIASDRFPNLRNLELTLGKPTEFLPVPTWHQWRLDAWIRLSPTWSYTATGDWQRHGTVYHRAASELVSLWQSEFDTGGLYKYVRFEISSWEFDAGIESWVETDQL